MALALVPACGGSGSGTGSPSDASGVGGAAGAEEPAGGGGSPDGSAGTVASAGSPSDSGGASEGVGGTEASSGGSAGGAAVECDDGTDWDAAWQQLECDAIALINERRATGYDCGSGSLASVGSVARHQLLTEIARDYLKNSMDQYDCFEVRCPGYEDYPDWVYASGFTGTMAYQVGAWGQRDAETLVDNLFGAESICEGLMVANADQIAVAHYDNAWMVYLASGGD
jgi:hypothetical protein